MSPRLVMVAAVGRNGAIGIDNGLPWRMPSDLKHFRALTMNRPVLMGRKTFDSIGKPLPGRAVVVVSANPSFRPPRGVEVAPDLDGALELCRVIAAERGVDETMVAGGAAVYRALLDRADRLHITEIDGAPDADAFFPAIDGTIWRETRRDRHEPAPGDDAAFAFVQYERR